MKTSNKSDRNKKVYNCKMCGRSIEPLKFTMEDYAYKRNTTEDDEGNVCLCIKRYEDYEPVVGFSKYKNGKLYVHIGYEDNPPLEIGSVYALLTIEDAERKLEELKFKNAYMKLSEKVRGEE